MEKIWKITQNKDWESLEKEFSWVADFNPKMRKIFGRQGS